MVFTPKSWVDGSGGGTPITAAELNRIEQGIVGIETATTQVSNRVALDPRDFFATAGGSQSNAAAAINAALVAAQTHTETRTVRIPAGTWGLETAVVIQGNGVTLEGTGPRTTECTLRINNNTDINALGYINNTNASQVGVRNIQIDCNVANNVSGTKQNGLVMNVDRALIEGVRLVNWRNYGFWFNAQANNTSATNGYLNRIRSNVIGPGSGTTSTGMYAQFTFNDSWVSDNYFSGSVYQLYSSASSLRIHNNHFDGSGGTDTHQNSIYLFGGGTIMIEDNFFEKAGRSPIFIFKDANAAARFQTRVNITGNSIREGSRLYPGAFPAIKLAGVATTNRMITALISSNTFGNETNKYSHLVEADSVEGLVASANGFNVDDLVASASPFYDLRGLNNTYAANYDNTVITTPPATGGADNFNRADESPLAVSSGNQVWNHILGGGLALVSNQAAPPDTAHRVSVMETGKADCTVQCTFVVQGFGSGIVARRTGNTWILVKSDGHIYTTTSNGGSFTDITGGTPAAFANGDVCAIVLSGTSITVKKNGTTGATATSSLGQTATEHGLRASTSTTYRFDDFSVV